MFIIPKKPYQTGFHPLKHILKTKANPIRRTIPNDSRGPSLETSMSIRSCLQISGSLESSNPSDHIRLEGKGCLKSLARL